MGGLWLKNVECLRTVEWSKSWLWDIRFPDGPGIFKDWFPATDVEENVWSLADKNWDAGFTSFAIPQRTSFFSLKVTFIDDICLSIEEWLDTWVNEEILGGGKYTHTLEDICKEVHVAKLDNKHGLVALNEYYVFPKGELFFSGNSQSGLHSNSIDFVIAGTKNKTKVQHGKKR
jgi:hypothetical protein